MAIFVLVKVYILRCLEGQTNKMTKYIDQGVWAMSSRIKIGCLTYGVLNQLTGNAVAKLNDPDLEVTLLEGLMEDLIDKVKEAFNDGVEVFVGGGANAEVVRTTEAPIVKIQLTAMDYIEAIIKAKVYGEKMAIVNYEKPLKYDYKKFEEVTGVKLLTLTFFEPREMEEKLTKQDIKVVIGASLAYETAEKLGLKGVLIYPGEEAIIAAINEAKNLAQALRKEKEKSQLTEAILDYTLNGLAATDPQGNIIVYNPAAEKILGMQRTQVLGRSADEVLPILGLGQVLQTRLPQVGVIEQDKSVEILVNRVPLGDGEEINGSLATFSKVSDIQKTEQRIRLLNKQKGFMAKANFADIVGKSKAIRTEVQKAKSYAKTNSNIFISGETGVGKEIFAQSIHNYSLRQDGPFVAINCAALPENLLESELFGYEEGAFTGSRKGGKIGLFELAHQGTIFLDEIGEIPPSLQARLLRVLQEKEVLRIGGERVIPIDVRIIAATNIKLEEKLSGHFRADLYYRLNVFQLKIAPLRDRIEDVIDLFMYFLKKHYNITDHKDVISEQATIVLTCYSWPGNVRELQNVAERFALFFKKAAKITEDVIREMLVMSVGEDNLFDDLLKRYNFDPNNNKKIPPELLEDLELVFPRRKSKIAEKLGISRTTLWRETSK